MHGDDGRAMVLMDAEDFEHLLALKGIEAQDLSA
jgi:hypothetical protein